MKLYKVDSLCTQGQGILVSLSYSVKIRLEAWLRMGDGSGGSRWGVS